MLLPILMATVFPALIMIGIAYVLRPKADAAWKTNHNVTYRPAIYVSKTWSPKKIEPYRVTPREDPADPTPIYDELEILMRESEARLNASIRACEILQELKIEAKDRLQLV